MAKLDAARREPAQRQFAASPPQIIKCDNSAVRFLSLERQAEMRANETSTSGDQNSHLFGTIVTFSGGFALETFC
jgi:hypothetical protein